MDKKGFKNLLITMFFIYLGMVTFVGVPFTIFVALMNLLSGQPVNFLNLLEGISFLFFAFFILISIIIVITLVVKLFIKLNNFNNSKIIGNNSKEYIREFPNNYSPAIVSAILDLNTEVTTDYPATVLYLCNKGYLNMVQIEDSFILEDNNNKNLETLNHHELYVYNCIVNKEIFENEKFISLVKKDAINLGLVKEGKQKKYYFLRIILAIVLFFIMGYLNDSAMFRNIFIFEFLAFLTIPLIFGTIAWSIYDANRTLTHGYIRTQKGNAQALEWIKFKNFIKDFTLLKEKDLDYVKLAGNYLPYAIALKEAKNIEKYIDTDEVYRSYLYLNVNII